MSNLFVYACIHLIVHMYINAHTYNKIQHNTIQHNTTQYNTTQYNTTQHNTTQHSTIQHNTTQCNTTQHNTIQHNTDGNMIADVKFFEGNGITKQQRRVRHEPIKFRIAYPPGGLVLQCLAQLHHERLRWNEYGCQRGFHCDPRLQTMGHVQVCVQ